MTSSILDEGESYSLRDVTSRLVILAAVPEFLSQRFSILLPLVAFHSTCFAFDCLILVIIS